MLKEKWIIPSVWGGIKGFEHFLRGECFQFWLCIRLIYELISPGWIKTRLYSVVSSYGYFFYIPRFITFAEPDLSLCSVKEPHCCYIRVNKLVRLINFLGNRRPASLPRSFFCCPSNNSQSFFHFSSHCFVFQCTVKGSVLYKNNFLYANCPFHWLWSRERQLPAVTSKQLTLFP